MKEVSFFIKDDDTLILVRLTEENPLFERQGGGHTDEGSAYWSEVFSLEDGEVYYEESDHGRDCDGAHSSYSKRILAKVEPREFVFGGEWCNTPEVKVTVPGAEWREIEREERDFTAERAGY